MPTRIRAPKATALLRDDHKKVKKLFSEFEKLEGGDSGRIKELFEELKTELEVHTQVEEEIFYPAFESAEDEESRQTVLEAHEEHRVAKTLLAELSGMSPDDETFRAKMWVLAENVRHHIEEEEGELFPCFDDLSREERDELSERLHARKSELQGG